MIEIENYIDLVAPNSRSRLKIRTSDELGTDTFIHITPDKKVKHFEPQISRRGALTEDNKLPRINVAATLLGAFSAYAAGYNDFVNTGGRYTIYGLAADAVVEPSKKHVYDVKQTGELWILGYNDKHRQIAPQELGEFFIAEVNTRRKKSINPEINVTNLHDKVLYFNLKEEIWLDGVGRNKRMLGKGLWRVAIIDERSRDSFKDDTVVDVSKITTSEYRKVFSELGHQRRRINTW